MRRDQSTIPTQRNGWGHAQDIVRERQQRSGQGHHQEGARDGKSERLWQGLQLRNKHEKGDRPPKGKDQAEREELSPTRCRREDHSKRSGSPGRQENRQSEAEASPEGEVSKPKRQPADRRQSRAGGPGSRPMARGAQWREPRTSQDPQLQWGPHGKRAPAAAGRKAEPPTEAQTPAGRKEGRVPKTTPDQ